MVVKKDKKENILLSKRIDKFIDWYYDNLVKNHYIKSKEINKLTKLRNFIEKMAVWYELKYPSIYFSDNIDVNSKFTFNEFYNLLDLEEKSYFTVSRYYNVLKLGEKSPYSYIYLSYEGYITGTEGIQKYTKNVLNDKDLIGLHITDLPSIFIQNNIDLISNNSINNTIDNVNKSIYFKQELLNSVLYCILERGNKSFGPRRGLLFAKEFNLDIDIPMIYGIDLTDNNLIYLIDEYLSLGGHKDLKCYVNYYSKFDNDIINVTNIKNLINKNEKKLVKH